MLQTELLNELTDNTERLKYFTILLTAGTWTISLSFFIQDITTEVYGYAKSRYLVQVSIAIVFCYILYTKLTTYFPISQSSNIDLSYDAAFDALPRHLIALLTALLISNLVNDYILSKLKIRMHGQYLVTRFILATAIGEAALQVVGTSIAWLGTLKFSTEIVPFITFSYLYKVSFEALMSPANIFICNKLKQAEGIDVYDYDINYNPFQLRSKK